LPENEVSCLLADLQEVPILKNEDNHMILKRQSESL